MKPMTAALACDPNRSVVVEACAGSGPCSRDAPPGAFSR
jgi:hypothetical protein